MSRRGLNFCDGFFPFPVPILEVWDGTTFFEDEVSGIDGTRKRPSSSDEAYQQVCGEKTDYPIGPLTLEEAAWLYWRVKEWLVAEDLASEVSASETYFGVSSGTPSMTGQVVDSEVNPDLMKEPILITVPFRFIGETPEQKTWYFQTWTTSLGVAQYLVGWDFVAENYVRFSVDEPAEPDDDAYPSNGGLYATAAFDLKNTIRFARTAGGDYYGYIAFSATSYCTSYLPSGAPLAEGSTPALGNSAVISSPYYRHQVILDLYDSETEITTQEYLDLPDASTPEVSVNPSENRNAGLGLEYGSLKRIVYLDDSEFSIDLPSRTLTVPLYNMFSQAVNFYDEWDGSTQSIVPPPSATLTPESFWTYGGIYDEDTGLPV